MSKLVSNPEIHGTWDRLGRLSSKLPRRRDVPRPLTVQFLSDRRLAFITTAMINATQYTPPLSPLYSLQ
jgi:hypothetical protein